MEIRMERNFRKTEDGRSIRSRAQNGLMSYGLSMLLPCPSVVEIAALHGYDFLRIDCEHAFLSYQEIRELMAAARLLGIPCQIRTPDLTNITALLGQEPAGIMIPHVESREAALAAVDCCKFAPSGRRGMDGSTRHMRCGGMKRAEYMDYANRTMDVIIQIESREGLRNIDEILSVEGIDMVATGRADLSQELGVPGEKNHPDVIEAENLIICKALEYGKIPTIAADSKARIAELAAMGVRCFLVGKDETLLSGAIKENLEKKKMNVKNDNNACQI